MPKWTNENMERAIEAANNSFSQRKGSLVFGVPLATLNTKINGRYSNNVGRQTLLS